MDFPMSFPWFQDTTWWSDPKWMQLWWSLWPSPSTWLRWKFTWYKNVGKSRENMEKIIEMLEHDVKFLKTLLEFDKYWNMMIHDDQFFLLCAKTITKDVQKRFCKTNLSWLRQTSWTAWYSRYFCVPSGNLLHNYGKIHHTIHGKTHYFNGDFQ